MFVENTSVDTILATTDDSESGYTVEVDLKHPDKRKQKRKYSPFCSQTKIEGVSQFTDYMNINKLTR